MSSRPQDPLPVHVMDAHLGPLIVQPAPACGPRPALSVIIPTLNEAENIGDFLREARHALQTALPGRFELIVVDDDSPDRTWEAAARLTAEMPELRVVRRRGEAGLARAVIRGWQAARGDVLGTINADFQHPPETLARMARLLDGADLVVATRHKDGGGSGDWQAYRRLTSWGAGLIGHLILPRVFSRISDPLSGCYFIRRTAISGIEFAPFGYKSLVEVVARGRVGRIRECGYQMRRRSRGQSKVRALHTLQYVRQITKLAAAKERAGR